MKTSFVDDIFVQSPLEMKTEEKVFILYYSLEVSALAKLCNFISRKIYVDHGIEVDSNFILSKGKNRISQEVYNIVLSYANYFDSLSDYLVIKDDPINPTGIRNGIITEFNKRFGRISTGENNNLVVDFNEAGKQAYYIVIIDHIGLMSKEQGFSKKENIDKMSEYLISLRNKLKITPVVVNQFNRSISSTDRHKLSMVVPQLSDFSDTASTQQDANVVLALFAPDRYGIRAIPSKSSPTGEIVVNERTRGLFLLKNRDGADSGNIIMDFNGKVKYFKEI